MNNEPEEIFCLRAQGHHSIFHRAADINKTTSSKFGGSLQNKNELLKHMMCHEWRWNIIQSTQQRRRFGDQHLHHSTGGLSGIHHEVDSFGDA